MSIARRRTGYCGDMNEAVDHQEVIACFEQFNTWVLNFFLNIHLFCNEIFFFLFRKSYFHIEVDGN